MWICKETNRSHSWLNFHRFHSYHCYLLNPEVKRQILCYICYQTLQNQISSSSGWLSQHYFDFTLFQLIESVNPDKPDGIIYCDCLFQNLDHRLDPSHSNVSLTLVILKGGCNFHPLSENCDFYGTEPPLDLRPVSKSSLSVAVQEKKTERSIFLGWSSRTPFSK